MTGEQQFTRLRAYVVKTAKRNAWPMVGRPFTGQDVRGQSAWRELLELLDTLARMHDPAAVEALDYLSDQLFDFEKGPGL